MPEISPDGRWLAYMSNESGRSEVYVRPFPDVDGGRWQVSTGGGDYPIWSPDGKELLFYGSGALMTVAVETDPAFKLGATQSLFPNKYAGGFGISPDGKKFLMLKQAATTGEASTYVPPREMDIVLNWSEELKRRVPGH
jgi:hypothetical protein